MTGFFSGNSQKTRLHPLLSFILFTVLILGPIFIALSFFSFYISTHAFPNSYLQKNDISLKTPQEISIFLDHQLNQPVQLLIHERNYSYAPRQIGFGINKKIVYDEIFKNNKGYLVNIIPFIQSLYSHHTYAPFVTISETFDNWFSKSVFDFSQKNDQLIFDDSVKEIKFEKNQEKYRLDVQALKEAIFAQMTAMQNSIINPTLIKIEENQLAGVAKNLNETYKNIVNSPVTINVDPNNKDVKITLDPSDLAQILNVNLIGETLKFTVNNDVLKNIVMNKFNNFPQYSDKTIDMAKVYSDMVILADSRTNGTNLNTIVTSTKFKPNSDGTVADKYIEIDISQQRMFLWEKGGVTADYLVSTGLYYPTPPGHYKILNKALNAFSYIYNVWMPYWMAFYMAPDIHAYLGIHELPYWVAGGGDIIRRPRDFLGSPHTGGCVSLDVGIAEKVYSWADIGTPVWIYE